MPVSIITPNFNNGPYVRQYLRSLLEDDAVGEIVIYDNCSTDDSADLLEKLGAPKVRLIRGAQNLGATVARQEALKAAKHEFICFVDGDDWLGPNAVSLAVESLESTDLDIALFQMIDVDADGSNPRISVPTPERPVDGRTAATLTMGGWRIHACGIVRRSLYDRAVHHFATHGYLSDEVLTRRLLLMARRVGGSGGEYYYRRIPKTLDPMRQVDWGRTTVRSLELAVDAKLDEEAVRAQRKMTLRFLLGLTRRALVGRMPRRRVAGVLDDYFRVPATWRMADLPWLALDRTLRLLRPILGRAEFPGSKDYR